MDKPAEMVCEQHAQMIMLARMWGVRMGDIELEHANILESPRVSEPISRTDVVLVGAITCKDILRLAGLLGHAF